MVRLNDVLRLSYRLKCACSFSSFIDGNLLQALIVKSVASAVQVRVISTVNSL